MKHDTQPIEARLIEQLESIIRNAQHQVYTSYRSEHGSSAASHPEPTSITTVEGYTFGHTDIIANDQGEQCLSSRSIRLPSGCQIAPSLRENDHTKSSAQRSFFDPGGGSSFPSHPPSHQISTQQEHLQKGSYQGLSSGILRSGTAAPGARPLQYLSGGEPSSSHSTLDLSGDLRLQNHHDNSFDLNSASVNFEGGSDDLDRDNFIGANSFELMTPLP